MAKKEVVEKVRPIVITDENGEKFTLEFNREAVRFAEMRGFDLDDVAKTPMTKVPEMFYYAFRMHHKNVSRQKTDKIFFEGIGGHSNMPEGFLERLFQLYAEPFNALNDEGEGKNPTATVEM